MDLWLDSEDSKSVILDKSQTTPVLRLVPEVESYGCQNQPPADVNGFSDIDLGESQKDKELSKAREENISCDSTTNFYDDTDFTDQQHYSPEDSKTISLQSLHKKYKLIPLTVSLGLEKPLSKLRRKTFVPGHIRSHSSPSTPHSQREMRKRDVSPPETHTQPSSDGTEPLISLEPFLARLTDRNERLFLRRTTNLLMDLIDEQETNS